MEIPLRAALIDWLRQDAGLATQLNSVTEEAPPKTALPWLAIATSASADWGAKDRPGREVRVALELHCRGDRPDTAGLLVGAVESRIASLPREQGGLEVVSRQFLRAHTEQRAGNVRSILLEYRFRVLAV